ncbi:hypothetical protein [Variovorax rhizosphaerae]|uniref:Uncharacterized protein n=1 Tax=Variovorax rhizosphaerae TaxID=1836200 RepID=A0ABU8WN97_9BURK
MFIAALLTGAGWAPLGAAGIYATHGRAAAAAVDRDGRSALWLGHRQCHIASAADRAGGVSDVRSGTRRGPMRAFSQAMHAFAPAAFAFLLDRGAEDAHSLGPGAHAYFSAVLLVQGLTISCMLAGRRPANCAQAAA